MSDTLVPEPQASVFDSVAKALGDDEDAARRVMLNPNLAKGFKNGKPVETGTENGKQDDACGCGDHAGACACSESQEDDIPLKAVDDIGRATAADVKEALHQVIDPELGIVWPEMDSEPLLSAKDRTQMSFREFKDSFGGFCL